MMLTLIHGSQCKPVLQRKGMSENLQKMSTSHTNLRTFLNHYKISMWFVIGSSWVAELRWKGFAFLQISGRCSVFHRLKDRNRSLKRILTGMQTKQLSQLMITKQRSFRKGPKTSSWLRNILLIPFTNWSVGCLFSSALSRRNVNELQPSCKVKLADGGIQFTKSPRSEQFNNPH